MRARLEDQRRLVSESLIQIDRYIVTQIAQRRHGAYITIREELGELGSVCAADFSRAQHIAHAIEIDPAGAGSTSMISRPSAQAIKRSRAGLFVQCRRDLLNGEGCRCSWTS